MLGQKIPGGAREFAKILREVPPKAIFWGQRPECLLPEEEKPSWLRWAYQTQGYGDFVAKRWSQGRLNPQLYEPNKINPNLDASFRQSLPWIPVKANQRKPGLKISPIPVREKYVAKTAVIPREPGVENDKKNDEGNWNTEMCSAPKKFKPDNTETKAPRIIGLPTTNVGATNSGSKDKRAKNTSGTRKKLFKGHDVMVYNDDMVFTKTNRRGSRKRKNVVDLLSDLADENSENQPGKDDGVVGLLSDLANREAKNQSEKQANSSLEESFDSGNTDSTYLSDNEEKSDPFGRWEFKPRDWKNYRQSQDEMSDFSSSPPPLTLEVSDDSFDLPPLPLFSTNSGEIITIEAENPADTE